MLKDGAHPQDVAFVYATDAEVHRLVGGSLWVAIAWTKGEQKGDAERRSTSAGRRICICDGRGSAPACGWYLMGGLLGGFLWVGCWVVVYGMVVVW